MEKLAIVCVFYDGYYDLWEDFLELFDRFWHECPYTLYIVNNVKNLEFKKNYNVKVIHSGIDAEYSTKVQVALDMIDSEYMLILLEDFFLSKSLDTKILDEVIECIEKNKIKYYMMPYEDYTNYYIHKYKDTDNLYCIYNNTSRTKYTLTCQPSIWERNFLKRCIGTEKYNAWIFEGIFAKSEVAHDYKFLKDCVIDNRNILGIKHGALQQKLIPATIEFYKSIGYEFKTEREQISDKEYINIKMKNKMRTLIPLNLRKLIKKLIRYRSVLDKYDEEIDKVIKNNNL